MAFDSEIYSAVQEAFGGDNPNVAPINPFAVAEKNGIKVVNDHVLPDGMQGFIMRMKDTFIIGYSKSLTNRGLINFTVAHELGHFFLPDHPTKLSLTVGGTKLCFPGREENNIEREADAFAAEMLMPTSLFSRELGLNNVGIESIRQLSDLFETSLTATANRYTSLNDQLCAAIVSDNNCICYSVLSEPLHSLLVETKSPRNLARKPYPRRSTISRVPLGSSQVEQTECYLDEWFVDSKQIKVSEETIGLGKYNRYLTILLCYDYDPDDFEEYED